MVDPGFPVGGAPTHWGGANLQHVHFLVKMYAKTKEIDPVGGGARRRRSPLDPPMVMVEPDEYIVEVEGRSNARYITG